MFSAIIKVFRLFGDRKIVLAKNLFVSVRTSDYARLAESVMFSLSIIRLRTGLQIKEDIFSVNILIARTLIFLLNGLKAEFKF